MKISKVKGSGNNNARMAVVVHNGHGEGIMYYSPVNSPMDNGEDTEYVKARISESKRMYSIFNFGDPEIRKMSKDDKKNVRFIKAVTEPWTKNAWNSGDKKILFVPWLVKDRDSEYKDYALNSYKRRMCKDNGKPSVSIDSEHCFIEKSDDVKLTINADRIINEIQKYVKENYKDIRKGVTEEIVDLVVNKYLKKSLRCREKTKNAVKCVLMRIYDLPGFEDKEIDIQREFIDYMLEDYYRIRVMMYTVKSIRGAKMPVQPEKIDTTERKVFLPSVTNDFQISEAKNIPKTRNTKKEEKEAINRFLSDYAVLDNEKRKEYLLWVRKIVNLYFYDTEEIIAKDAFMEHAARKNEKDCWVEGIPTISKDIEEKKTEKNNKKQWLSLVRIAFHEKNMYSFSRCENVWRNRQDFLLARFFLQRISKGIERISKGINYGEEYKLSKGYVSEKIWKDLINFLSTKYIAIGKAVFHYAMEDLDRSLVESGDTRNFGIISKDYVDGFSSFDYELIKAKETLQREIAVYVSFAVRHLAHQTVNLDAENSDFLLLKGRDTLAKGASPKTVAALTNDVISEDNVLKFVKKTDLRRAILQFFGGASQWVDFDLFDGFLKKTDLDLRVSNDHKRNVDIDMLMNFKEILYSMRNQSYHYITKDIVLDKWNYMVIGEMFSREATRASKILKDKFYTNNLHKFYKTEDLEKLITHLYKCNTERMAQIPSFNHVFVRINFPQIVSKEIFNGKNGYKDNDQALMYQNALYYMLKEIYYNLFLQDKKSLDLFFDECAKDKIRAGLDDKERKKEKFANRDFRNKIEQIKKSVNNKVKESPSDDGDVFSANGTTVDLTLADICQQIMAEQNRQNSGDGRKSSSQPSKREERIYQHYKMLLIQNIRDAFIKYIKIETKVLNESINGKELFGFIMKPNFDGLNVELAKEEFLPNLELNTYASVVETVKNNPSLQRWYIMGRMLSPKQLNILAGDIRNYKSFVDDIDRRATLTGIKLHGKNNSDKILGESYTDIDAVIDMCIKLSGSFSNDITDYFDHNMDEGDREEEFNDYAKYISSFVNFNVSGDAYSSSLINFCQDLLNNPNNEEQNRIYSDNDKPIANRNIINAKLFGEKELLEKIVEKVSRSEIDEYFRLRKQINTFKGKKCYNKEEILANKEYQEIKNHIELRDLVDYSELADQLQARLINWCYMRERDLMYYQLGFHYMCLNNASKIPELYKTIELCENDKDKVTIENAILYQICAMYISGIPMMYHLDENSKCMTYSDRKASVSTGTKIKQFIDYAKLFGGENNCGEYYYFAGLELFEEIDEHDNITNLRNYIDHFRYYVEQDRSMLDIYSEVFDRFFTYDMKLRKNMPNALYNILLSYHACTKFKLVSGKKEVGTYGNTRIKEMAQIILDPDWKVSSDIFTYKINEKDTIEVFARGRRYLETIIRLLYYKKGVEMDANTVSDMIYSIEEKQEIKQLQEKKISQSNNIFVEGAILAAVVKSIMSNKGLAFIEFENGEKGTVHISEIADRYIKNIEDELTIGQEVRVKCLGKDKKYPDRYRFSIKACNE